MAINAFIHWNQVLCLTHYDVCDEPIQALLAAECFLIHLSSFASSAATVLSHILMATSPTWRWLNQRTHYYYFRSSSSPSCFKPSWLTISAFTDISIDWIRRKHTQISIRSVVGVQEEKKRETGIDMNYVYIRHSHTDRHSHTHAREQIFYDYIHINWWALLLHSTGYDVHPARCSHLINLQCIRVCAYDAYMCVCVCVRAWARVAPLYV